jgi:hypothetical protein
MKTIEITETKPSQRETSIIYQACLKDQPDVQGEGKTVNQAIGDLVVSNQDLFGFQIEFPR